MAPTTRTKDPERPTTPPAAAYVVTRPRLYRRCGAVARLSGRERANPPTRGPHIPTQCPAPPRSPDPNRSRWTESVGQFKPEHRLSPLRDRHRRLPLLPAARATDEHARAAVDAVGAAGERDPVPSHLHSRHRQVHVGRGAPGIPREFHPERHLPHRGRGPRGDGEDHFLAPRR